MNLVRMICITLLIILNILVLIWKMNEIYLIVVILNYTTILFFLWEIVYSDKNKKKGVRK